MPTIDCANSQQETLGETNSERVLVRYEIPFSLYLAISQGFFPSKGGFFTERVQYLVYRLQARCKLLILLPLQGKLVTQARYKHGIDPQSCQTKTRRWIGVRLRGTRGGRGGGREKGETEVKVDLEEVP